MTDRDRDEGAPVAQQYRHQHQRGREQPEQVGARGREQVAEQDALEVDGLRGQYSEQDDAAGEPGMGNDSQRGFRQGGIEVADAAQRKDDDQRYREHADDRQQL